MKLQHGFVGKTDITKAIVELESWSFNKDKNIWVERPHTGNYIKGQWYGDIEELLSDFDSIDKIETAEEYDEHVEEMEIEKDQRVLDILKSGKTAYIDYERDSVDSDKSCIVKGMIEDGQEDSYYTYDEARKNLKSDDPDETLVIWLLS